MKHLNFILAGLFFLCGLCCRAQVLPLEENVVLNTKDLRILDVGSGVPGIYLRDKDPDARPSERNSDLLLERASATVVKELAIGTDKGWQPAFPYQGNTKGGILRHHRSRKQCESGSSQ